METVKTRAYAALAPQRTLPPTETELRLQEFARSALLALYRDRRESTSLLGLLDATAHKLGLADVAADRLTLTPGVHQRHLDPLGCPQCRQHLEHEAAREAALEDENAPDPGLWYGPAHFPGSTCRCARRTAHCTCSACF